MNYDETYSPTVATQALLLSSMIDAYERRDIATSDIPGAFLQTPDESKETHLRLETLMVDLLLKINPWTYRSYVCTDKRGKRYMYAQCQKAIYGTLRTQSTT